jgi:hypothetical protein
MYLPDGSVFEGDFVEGEMTGHGKRVYPNGASYEGDFFRGEQHGKGKYIYPDGSIYDGYFKERQRCGKGKLTFANGDVFEGHFEKHHFHGLSRFVARDGTIFEGDFENGKRNGHGIEVGADGSKYDGGWKDNLKSGFGVFEGVAQVRYEGEFLEGKALDASQYLDFDHSVITANTSDRIIANRGSTLPPIAVTCYCENREKPLPQSDDDNQSTHSDPHNQPGDNKINKKNPDHKNPPKESGNALAKSVSKDKKSNTGAENQPVAESGDQNEDNIPSHHRASKESGRLLQLTIKPLKLKDKTVSEKKNIELFLTRGTVGDAAVGKMPPVIPRLVKLASPLVPETMSLDYMMGTVTKHQYICKAKYGSLSFLFLIT